MMYCTRAEKVARVVQGPGRPSKTSLHVPRAARLTHPGQQAPQRHACHQWPARTFQASSETLLSPAACSMEQLVAAASVLLSLEASKSCSLHWVRWCQRWCQPC